MDMRHLELFCRIVDRRSFSLAAEDLHITQPAASQQVRSLERELKTTLLDRSSRRVGPTDAGQVLYRYAREILALHELACTEILDLEELVSGHVVLGASTGPGEHLMPALLTRFRGLYPGVRVSMSVDATQHVIERVVSREFELGAVGAPTAQPDLVAEPFAHDEVVLVCGPAHPWAGREAVSLDELASAALIVQQYGAGIRAVVDDHLRAAGLPPERLTVVAEMGLMESAKQAAIAGGGVTFVSGWAIGPELEHGALAIVPVDGLDIRRDFYVVRSRSRVLSRAAEALLAYLREQYEAVLPGPRPR
jgi:LysR family transcriptional regulator, transcriptional activator of the cysJI operon